MNLIINVPSHAIAPNDAGPSAADFRVRPNFHGTSSFNILEKNCKICIWKQMWQLRCHITGVGLYLYNNVYPHKQWETHGCILSTVAPNAQVSKAPGHQYPQFWLNHHCIGLIIDKNIRLKWTTYKTQNFFLKIPSCEKIPHCLRVDTIQTFYQIGKWVYTNDRSFHWVIIMQSHKRCTM